MLAVGKGFLHEPCSRLFAAHELADNADGGIACHILRMLGEQFAGDTEAFLFIDGNSLIDILDENLFDRDADIVTLFERFLHFSEESVYAAANVAAAEKSKTDLLHMYTSFPGMFPAEGNYTGKHL
jgi:hypothetical protein